MSRTLVIRATTRAAEQRGALGIGDEPILGLRDLLEREGLLVYGTRVDGGSLSGCFAVIGDDDWIMVNTAHTVGRQRFTLAHEYCHALEHHDRGLVVCTREKSPHEVYADAFAAAFLMPSDPTERFFAAGVASGAGIDARRVIEYCHVYGVSFEAAVYRLHNLRLLTARERDDLLDERPVRLARVLGYDPSDPSGPFFRSGPGDGDEAGGLPRAYRAAALQAYEGGRISESKLASLFGMDVDDLDDILSPDEPDEVPIVS